MFGNGLGRNDSFAGYAHASLTAFRNPGIPKPARAVSIRLERTPGVGSKFIVELPCRPEAREKNTPDARAVPSSETAPRDETVRAMSEADAKPKGWREGRAAPQ